MSAKKYFGAFCLYLNYLVHGIGVLVMSLNVHEFEVQWQTDAAGVSVVISSLGLGRLALLVLAGSLSDKYGRRPFVLLGTVTYLAFFIGLLLRMTSERLISSDSWPAQPTVCSMPAPILV